MLNLLVFGGTGQVGRSLRARSNPEIMITAPPRRAADLTNPNQCAELILNAKVDAVINAAAFTDVNAAEREQARAMQINADAPGVMAQACAQSDLPFLHISTDYVFTEGGRSAISSDRTPDPINAYGRSKLAGEQNIRAAGGRYAILRTSWVFSEYGANFVKTMLRLARDQTSISVVGDQVGGPTPAADLAWALEVMAAAMVAGHKGGVYHFAGAPHVSWADFAREIFAQSQKSVEVTSVASSDYPNAAARPLNSRLDQATLTKDFGVAPPDWRHGLQRVIKILERG